MKLTLPPSAFRPAPFFAVGMRGIMASAQLPPLKLLAPLSNCPILNSMNRRHYLYSVPRLLLALLVSSSALFAQSTQSSTPPAVPTPSEVAARARDAGSASNEDAVILSPFVVSTDQDRGYSSASTLSGTRLDTPAKFVAASISEINKALMDDLGMYNMNELVDFATNSQAMDNSRYGSFSDAGQNSSVTQPFNANIRGKQVGSTSRDFFVTRAPDDGYNTDRVSVNRGPNSILFGIGSPYGIVSSVSLWPTMKPSYQLATRFDNWGSDRVSLRLNQPIIPGKVFFLFAGLNENLEVNLKPSNRRNERLYGALTIKPFKSTTIRANFEHGLADYISARAQPLQDGLSAWIAAGHKELPPELQNGGARFATFLTKTPAQTAQQPALDTLLTTLGFQLNTAGTNQKLTMMLNSRSPMPWMSSLGVAITRYNQGVGIAKVQNQTLVNSPIPYTANVCGVNSGYRQHFQTYNLIVNQNVGKNLFIEARFNRQNSDYLMKVMAPQQNNWLMLDKNPTLVTALGSIIPNPNYNRYFVGYVNGGLNKYYKDDDNALVQAAYKWDFTKQSRGRLAEILGRHDLFGLWQRSAADQINLAAFAPRNATPLALEGKIRQMPATYFTQINQAGNNPLQYVSYIDPGDKSTWVIPDQEKIFGPYKEFWPGDPLPPADPSGITPFYPVLSGNRGFLIINSKVAALQSYFWRERIATTLGWREDVAVNRSFQSSVASAVTYNGMTGWQAKVADVDRYKGNQYYPVIFNKQTGRTYTAGVVAYPLSWLGLFYNQSKNYSSVASASAVDIWGNPLPASTAVGKDWGIRLSLLKGKIDLNIAQYTTTETDVGNSFFRVPFGGVWVGENARVAVSNELYQQTNDQKFLFKPWVSSSAPQTWSGIGDNKADGYEISLTANPVPNWRITVSLAQQKNVPSQYGADEREWYDWALDYVKKNYPNSLNVSTGPGVRNVSETLAEKFDDIQTVLLQMQSLAGRRDSRQPEFTGSLVTAYDFVRGPLKNSGIGGSYRYRGRTAIGYAFLPGSTTLFDPNKPFYGDNKSPIGVFAYYRFKIGEKVRCRVQVNADNVNMDQKLHPWLATDDGTGKPAIVSYAVGPGQTWALSTTFDF